MEVGNGRGSPRRRTSDDTDRKSRKDRRNGHRGRQMDSDPDSSGGEETQVDRESNKKRRNEGRGSQHGIHTLNDSESSGGEGRWADRDRDRDKRRRDEGRQGLRGGSPLNDSDNSGRERRQIRRERDGKRRDEGKGSRQGGKGVLRGGSPLDDSESSGGEGRTHRERDGRRRDEERGNEEGEKGVLRGESPLDLKSSGGEGRMHRGRRDGERRDHKRGSRQGGSALDDLENSGGEGRWGDREKDDRRRISQRGGSPLDVSQSSGEGGRHVDSKRGKEKGDEQKRSKHGRSPIGDDSQSSDEGKGLNKKMDRKSRYEGKRNKLQGSSEDGSSDSTDGDRRQLNRERHRRERERRRYREEEDDSTDSDGRRKRDRWRREEQRDRDKKDRIRNNKHYHDRRGDIRAGREKKERQVPESKGDSRDGRGEEAPKAQREQLTASLNANPGSDVATLGRTGGVYIPPFKLARMMKEIEDKSSIEYQRLTWDALRKSINGLVNKVNATNIKNIIPELFGENLIRGRGLFCRSCMKSQMASPGFTDVFAALVAVVNTKFPEIGDLLLRRIILQLKRAYKRNDKPQLIAAVKFIAHLVNHQVAHELVALELLTVLLEQPTDDSVEVAVDFVKECGSILQDLCPKGLHGIFERFRGILHEGEIDKRVQFLIEGLFAIRKAKFQGHPAVRSELDLVEPEDQLTHEVSLDDQIDPEISLDIFKSDPNFTENERRYEELKKSILGEESEDEDGSDAGSDAGSDDDEEEDEDDDEEEAMQIKDATETNLINLRRTIYLTIMSSVDFEEAGHKLLKIKLEPGQEMELCIMLLECCSQERTYLRYYGLLGQRFCMVNKVYQENFEKCFVQQYSMIHRLETNKLRNVAKFFAHLLGTDALPWHVLAYIRLTEEDTTSSSRIFIKILFQELSEHLGIRLLNERLNDPAMQDSFDSIFPKDNPRNTRFAINFFTSIGLGGITENLREYLKNMPRMIMQQQKPASEDESKSYDSGSSSSGSESSSSESSGSDDSESSGEKRRKRRKKN